LAREEPGAGGVALRVERGGLPDPLDGRRQGRPAALERPPLPGDVGQALLADLQPGDRPPARPGLLRGPDDGVSGADHEGPLRPEVGRMNARWMPSAAAAAALLLLFFGERLVGEGAWRWILDLAGVAAFGAGLWLRIRNREAWRVPPEVMRW